MKNVSRWAVLALCAALILASAADAKKVVCVDGGSDPDLNGYEGWISSQLTVPPDVVKVGGTLNDCMALVAKGDELIIIAHGVAVSDSPPGLGFRWSGTSYSGFGTGTGYPGFPPHKVPAGFAALNHVTITMGMCWSARDPAGPQVSVLQSLLNAMQGAANTGSGYNGKGTNNTIVTVGNPDRNSAEQIAAAEQALRDKEAQWKTRAPKGNKRNPPPADDQERAARNLLDQQFPNKNIPVTIKYTRPRDDQSDPFGGHLAAVGGPSTLSTQVCAESPSVYVSGPPVPVLPGYGGGVLALLLAAADRKSVV